MRVHRPGFICGIDVNIVAEGGASQTEGQLRDREGVGERGQVYIAALRLREKEGGRRTHVHGWGGRGPGSVLRRPSFPHLFWRLNMRRDGMGWDGGYCAPTPSLCEDG